MSTDAVAGEDELDLVRDTADRIAERCLQEPAGDHTRCWNSLQEAGFTELRHPGDDGEPAASTEVTGLVVERLARVVCGASLLGHLLASELLRVIEVPQIAEVPQAGEPLTVVLDQSWRGLAGESGIAWDAACATAGIGRREGGVVRFELATARSSVDASRSLRHVRDGVECGPFSAEAARSFEAFARTLLAADMLGCASGIVDRALDYVKERVQFGVAVGSFQAVQHLCAEAYVRLEGLRSALAFAQRACDADDGTSYRAALVAKSYADEAAVGGVETAIQLFGGIAITAEHRAHRHLRRVLLDREVFGNAEILNDALFELEES